MRHLGTGSALDRPYPRAVTTRDSVSNTIPPGRTDHGEIRNMPASSPVGHPQAPLL